MNPPSPNKMTPDLPPVLPGHLPPLPEGTTYGGRLKDYSGYVFGYTLIDGMSWDEEPTNWSGMKYELDNSVQGSSGLWHIAIPIARANGIGGESTSDPCESESPKTEERYSPEVRQAAYDAANQEDGDHWSVLDAAKPPDIAMADFIEIVLGIKKPTPPKPEGETPLTDALAKELEDSPVNIETACEHLLDHARQLESDLAAARASLKDMETKANRNRQIRDSLVKIFKEDGWQDDCTLINELTNMNFDITPHQP